MKGTYNLIIRRNKLKYELTITDRYSIVCGGSGTGKTTVCDFISTKYIEAINQSVKTISIEINGEAWEEANNKVYYLPYGVQPRDFLKDKKKSIVFIDEYHEIFKKSNLKTKLNNLDNYFVLITRKCIGSLSIDVKSIFEIKTDNNGIEFINKFEPVGKETV
jgi:replication-associated recombination protein RarA